MELILSRIIAGRLSFRLGGKHYLLFPPTREERCRALEIHEEAIETAQLEGLFDEVELLTYLVNSGQWSPQQESRLKELPDLIENTKVSLFESIFQSDVRRRLRNELDALREEWTSLYTLRHQQDHLSIAGFAEGSKNKFLLACGLTSAGVKLYEESNFWTDSTGLLDQIQSQVNSQRPTETQCRQLARTDPWRSSYIQAKLEGKLFGVSPLDYSDDQKLLVSWSMLYDNCYQNPDCPADDIVSDDDTFDGWLILQKRKRQENQIKSSADSLVSDKIKQCQEIFLPASTIEDARKIEALNDPMAKMQKQSKMAAIKQAGGEISEWELPSVKRQIQMEAANRAREALKPR